MKDECSHLKNDYQFSDESEREFIVLQGQIKEVDFDEDGIDGLEMFFSKVQTEIRNAGAPINELKMHCQISKALSMLNEARGAIFKRKFELFNEARDLVCDEALEHFQRSSMNK